MTPEDSHPILQPGRNCWKMASADRMAVVIDAANYFRHLRDAMLQAERRILLIGWDFDTRISLVHEDEAKAGAKDGNGAGNGAIPHRLGEFLSWLVEHRPDLEIHILKWDLGTIQALGRGSTPLFILDWITSERIRFRLDSAHPPTGAHHQKIAVIDDVLAFCGGIDTTADRWDTREHLDDDPRRARPTTGRAYGPWHDVATAATGPAARLLGEVARDRWLRATGEELDALPPLPPIWPEGLEPLVEGAMVAVSRTMPEYGDAPAIDEIAHLYLDAIASARQSLYIESQYFAARSVAEAICARLAEPDGPEIVVVNPETANGWLEEKVMGASRARLLEEVGNADRHGRFRIYCPVTEGGTPIYVHAKVLVVDDRLLRVGSSNLNNRSLGFDSECDLSLEAPAGAAGDSIRRRIVDLRNDLLAEHLGTTPEAFAAAVEAEGSLIRTIEGLRGPGRSLVPFEPPELGTFGENVLAENGFLDPEGTSAEWRRVGLADLVPWSRGTRG